MAQKMSEKSHSIQLLRRFNFSQLGSRKSNRKIFEGASIEPTSRKYAVGVMLMLVAHCHIASYILLQVLALCGYQCQVRYEFYLVGFLPHRPE